MKVFSSKSNNANQNKKPTANKKTIYVYPGKSIIAKVLNNPFKSRYSYGVEIEPLDGNYYDSKNKKWYKAKELANYRVVLNLKDEDAKGVRKGDILVKGIDVERFILLGDE
ncbi:hypothetical protein SJAV_13280 [Sulfurisphaera javensis]|uniref:Uncharacterized protein n=1 Tax=Sulfurisphaera javensis TaxID=2049879 RepID=A0AAT9GRE1_9CREN